MEKALFLQGFFFLSSLLITYFITLSLEKELLFWKKSGESLEFWIKNLYEPCAYVPEKESHAS